jgi:hypothetical protein
VLQGAENFLARARCKFVQFEYNTHWIRTGSTLWSAFDLLDQHGFVCFLIRSTGLHPLNYHYWGDFFRYSNFLAVYRHELNSCESLIRGPI